MQTTSHADRAAELFLSGYNCAQSVFGAFCDVTGMDFSSAMRLSSSFGGGMGRLAEVPGGDPQSTVGGVVRCAVSDGWVYGAGLLFGSQIFRVFDVSTQAFGLFSGPWRSRAGCLPEVSEKVWCLAQLSGTATEISEKKQRGSRFVHYRVLYG